jgi:DNA-binding transcriptional ArsR family regulator
VDDLDSVFKALADPTRRALLDSLANDDGQTLSTLAEGFPEMTRFGVMKHLRLLETAHLVVTEKHGREKFHYLNPVPIREIHDRWISRYAESHVAGLLALRDRSEGA